MRGPRRLAAAGGLALLLASCGPAAPPPLLAPASPLPRGVHYFGSAWPLNFWNSTELHDLEKDLAAIGSDGFDTIVLVVPWGEFQPGIFPIRYSEPAFARLKRIVGAARTAGLQVLLRLGYTWDFDASAEGAVVATEDVDESRLLLALTDPLAHAAWLDFIGEVHEAVGRTQGVGAFLTWEDQWGLHETIDRSDLAKRLSLASRSGFQQYVASRRGNQSISGLFRTPITTPLDIPLPERRAPAKILLLEFLDHATVERFFLPARERYPGLTLEVRLDVDYVHLPGGSVCGYDHGSTFDLPVERLFTYYTTAWGALNRGDTIGAAQALANMDRSLRYVRGHTRAPGLFIDQLNVLENARAHQQRTRINAAELPAFVEGLGDVLVRHDAGYALWTYRDYEANAFYNASFEVGAAGWRLEGGAEVVAAPGGDAQLHMPPGSSATQTLSHVQVARSSIDAGTSPLLSLSCSAGCVAGALEATFAPGTTRVLAPSGPGTLCVDAPLQPGYTIRLTAASEVTIDDVSLHAFVQEGGVIGADGTPGPLREPFRRLNARLGGTAH